MVGVFVFLRPSRNESGQAKPAPAVSVTTQTARQGDIGIYVTGLGSVTPVYTVDVRTLVDGQLLRVNYREGDLVREGALLAEVDPRPFEAQLMQFQGEYERDKALLDNALIDLNRYEASYAKRAIPEQQLATQKATVRQDQGTVKLDEGQIAATKLNLLYCRITAPISGRIGLRLVDPGNIVHTAESNALLVLTQVQPITVIFNMAEDYLPQVLQQLRQGHPLEVGAYDRAWNTLLATGSVLALDNQIDPSTGTLRVRAIFTNDDNTLYPNQFVNAKLLLGTQHDATLVPAEAVQRNTQGAYLFVVQTNQTIAMRTVEVRATEGSVAAVEGLKPGEVIATDNFNRLQEGTRIEPVAAPPGATNNSSTNSGAGGGGL
jgi:multidrug efflux system membrane fusion protein